MGSSESAYSKQARDQGSEDFVHLDIPDVTLLEKLPRNFRRPVSNEACLKMVDIKT